ncbi:MAG TPA: hypothetical protein VIJ68_00210 [Candidatus Saccharimonadales bacterium]
MFFHFPLQATNLRQIILLLNTVLLIVALIVVELIYSEAPMAKRRELRYFYPLFIVSVGLLICGVYVQRNGL